MDDREKLIRLLITANNLSTLDREADFLLAHGVTIREPGEWIVKDSSEESTLCECSKCHVWLTFYEGCYSPNFCPACGSPMEGESNA